MLESLPESVKLEISRLINRREPVCVTKSNAVVKVCMKHVCASEQTLTDR